MRRFLADRFRSIANLIDPPKPVVFTVKLGRPTSLTEEICREIRKRK